MFTTVPCPYCRGIERCFILDIHYGKKLITYNLLCVSGEEFYYYASRD